MAGSYKVTPPDLGSCKSYEIFQKELAIWELTTPVPEEKMGAVIASMLPNDSKLKKDLKDKFFENVVITDLAKAGGLKLVKDFLDKELSEDDLEKRVRTWYEFEDCVRGSKDIEDFLSEFDRQYQKAKNASKVKIPEEIRAFMVLKRSNVTKVQRMLILSKLDKDDKDNMFENICREIKLVLGGGPGAAKDKESSEAIKFEAEDLPSEDVLWSFGYARRGHGGGRGGRGGGGGYRHGGGGKAVNEGDHYSKPYDRDGARRPNRPGQDGKPTRCHHCESIYHFLNKCPDKQEKRESVVKPVLFTEDEAELSQFTKEARNCGALDTGCTSSVSGKIWLEMYLESLDTKDRQETRGPLVSDRVFKFGNDGKLKSEGKYFLPAVIAGMEVELEVDYVDSDIPLLLSKKAMKKAGMVIDMRDDTVTAFGKKTKLVTTSSGHYCIPLSRRSTQEEVDQILAVNLVEIPDKEQYKWMVKLHKQFGHTPKDKFIVFMKDARVWHDGLEKHLDRIIQGCEGCIQRQRNPDRPVVCLPMANSFNEKVAIDLKKWKRKHILHMVDMWSRLTISVIIERKKPKEVIDKIMERWIGYFGTMRAVLNDNGGEFTAQEVREVKEILNVEDQTTGAESPWQNGLCEKNHAIVDTMLERMVEDYPETDEQVLLGWANMAKNSMQMVYGYSSNQLVFGTNPNLPNIMSDGLPAMEGKTSSEVFAKHLNALHAARKAFIESESSERIRKALKKKVSTNNTIFHHGDRVYYKRERDGRWRGPAHVIFQDGKIIFVRHGSVYVRVSANRIVKKGEEFQENNNKDGTIQEVGPAATNVIVAADDTTYEENTESIASDTEAEVDVDIDENVPEMLLLDSEPDGEENLDENVTERLLDQNNIEMQVNENISEDPDASTVITDDGRKKRKAIESEGSLDKRPRIVETTSIQRKTKTIHPKSQGKKINLKRNDLIDIQMQDGDWLRATVSDRSKVSGSFYNYFNVRGEDGLDRNVDLERLRFKEVCEEVNMVLIPQERHKDEDCKAAKQVELRKLEDFEAFKVVDDVGQYRISCMWILWVKGDETRARLCARGYEEAEAIPSDSPTVDKPNIRVLLLTAASYGWVIESSDVKSAFLQGRALDRTVTLTPPREANVEKGKLWELNVALYGLDDASLQFFF